MIFRLSLPLRRTRRLLLFTAALSAGAFSLEADVIYRETFGIPPGATADSFATVFDWQRFDNNGVEITTGGTSAGVNFSAVGRRSDVANVNAGPNADGTFDAYVNGILYFGAGMTPSLGFTPEFSFNPSNYVPGSIVFSWYEGNNTAPHSFRFLLRIDGQWFASAGNPFTTQAIPLTSFGTQAELKSLTYDPTASNWLTVNFNGDFTLGPTAGTGTTTNSTLGALALGGPPPGNLSGMITAFGFYGESNGGTGNRRVDTVQIDALSVPEPGMWGYLAVTAAVLGGFKRRSKL
jgi:hypothetical protein